MLAGSGVDAQSLLSHDQRAVYRRYSSRNSVRRMLGVVGCAGDACMMRLLLLPALSRLVSIHLSLCPRPVASGIQFELFAAAIIYLTVPRLWLHTFMGPQSIVVR